MPVRSSTSSVLRWPDRQVVHAALADWARAAAKADIGLRRVGYFGSYATNAWGPGSDLDVVLVIDVSERSFMDRGARWDLTSLPVPAEVLVYTEPEWEMMTADRSRFSRALEHDVVWVHPQESATSG
jgi:predicted nucleotidyltransferase